VRIAKITTIKIIGRTDKNLFITDEDYSILGTSRQIAVYHITEKHPLLGALPLSLF
jgi:hypothetical protein